MKKKIHLNTILNVIKKLKSFRSLMLLVYLLIINIAFEDLISALLNNGHQGRD